MMLALLVVLVSSASVTTAYEGDRCRNESKTIENGRIVCEFPSGTSYSPRYEHSCLVFCEAGYHPVPIASTKCSRMGRYRGYTNSDYRGYWSTPIDQITCEVSSTCPSIDRSYFPENGQIECDSEGERKKCTRTCEFPFVPSEPEFAVERCGPDTGFIWSHYLRHNSSIMPPCQRKSECLDISETTFSHGDFVCRDANWATTRTCNLVCHRGYMPTGSNQEVFCGPATAFSWTHEWFPLEDGGCKIAPVSIVVTLSTPCAGDHRKNVETMTTYFNATNEDLKGRRMWRMVNWRQECFTKEDEQETKYYFNFQDNCIDGTCNDACNALKAQNATESDLCYILCNKPFQRQEQSLIQMRNITIHHIAKTLAATRPDIEKQFNPGEFKSLVVDVGRVEFKGSYLFESGSGFCRSRS